MGRSAKMPKEFYELYRYLEVILKHLIKYTYWTPLALVSYLQGNRSSAALEKRQAELASDLGKILMYHRKHRSYQIPEELVSRVVTDCLDSLPLGLLEDTIHQFLELTKDYLEKYRNWENSLSLYSYDTRWWKVKPEDVLEARDTSLELSLALQKIEKAVGANRQNLHLLLKNMHQVYTLYLAVRKGFIEKFIPKALKSLAEKGKDDLSRQERLELAGIALLEAYRCYRRKNGNFPKLIEMKVLDVLEDEDSLKEAVYRPKRLRQLSKNLSYSDSFLEDKKTVKYLQKALVREVTYDTEMVESLKAEDNLYEGGDSADPLIAQSWSINAMLLDTFLNQLPLKEAKLIILKYRHWGFKLSTARKNKKGDVAELLKQYAARFVYS